MSLPQATVEFPGLRQVLAFSGTWNHGVEPSSFIVDIIPQPPETIALWGTLRLRYGSTVIDFPDCLVDSGSYSLNQSGEVVSLTIRDYRWKWEYANITGAFNVRDIHGNLTVKHFKKDTLLLHSKRTFRELVKAHFEAMGVSDWKIIADVPATFPEVIADEVNAARSLQSILSSHGLRLAPQLSGSVWIVTAGEGQLLPTDTVESIGAEINPREIPNQIRVVTGPVYSTQDFALIPQLLLPDGRLVDAWQDFNGDSFDWRNSDLFSGFGGLPEAQQKLASESLFRKFRIVPENSFSRNREFPSTTKINKFPGVRYAPLLQKPEEYYQAPGLFGFQASIFQSLPLDSQKTCETVLVGTGPDDSTQIPINREAFIWGAFYHQSDAGGGYGNSATFADDIDRLTVDKTVENQKRYIVPYSWSLDAQHGIVTFSEPVYRLGFIYPADKDDQLNWPQLYLRIAARFRLPETGLWARKHKIRTIDSKSPAKELVIKLDDIIVHHEVDGTTNEWEVDRYLDEYIDKVAVPLLTPQLAGSATYASWFRFELDGAIQSITWRLDAVNGASMAITRNADHGSETSAEYALRQSRTAFKKLMDDKAVARAIPASMDVIRTLL